MPRIPLLVVIPPVVFGLLAGLFYVGMYRDDADALPSALVGRVVPSLELEPLGDSVLLEDALLREGGAKLVNFWASWCAPCRAEHPLLEELAAEGVEIHGVNFRDDPAKAIAFLRELGDPYVSIGADPRGRMGLNWGLYGVPETFVLDGDGRLVLRFAGPITRSVLENTIRPALEQAGG